METNETIEEHPENVLFKNNAVNVEELPQLNGDNFTKLEQEYLYLKLTSLGIFTFLIYAVLVMLYFVADLPLVLSLAVFTGLVVLVFIIEIMGFKIKGYALREHDISYKSGLLFFSMTSVPFNRIQHCEVSQGPLARLFDLGSVKVYTAGGSSSDLSISGLTKENAHKLREHITQLAANYA